MSTFIPLSVPNLSGNEKKYVNEVLETGWVSTAGSFVNRFEEELAQYVGLKKAVACQSGTAGLHLSLLALGINANDEVIVPTLTFIAAVNPVKYVGASPVFMDCDDSLCIDPLKVQQFIDNETYFEGEKLINKKTRKQIKAIIAVHIFGNMCDMEQLMRICQQYGLFLIEDATEALGTKYKSGRYAGHYAGTIGSIGVFSFNGNKIITTGGGGMVVSKDEDLLTNIQYLSTQAKDDEVNFIHNAIGYNYRMTNIQAAIGVAQLEQLDQFIEIKKNNFNKYNELLGQFESCNLLPFRTDIEPNYWFYSLKIDCFLDNTTQDINKTKQRFIQHMKENAIQVRPIWGLIHNQAPYQKYYSYNILQAVMYEKCIINVPCSSNLTELDIATVVDRISKWI